jgi:5-methylcytosine-specific restriction protein A
MKLILQSQTALTIEMLADRQELIREEVAAGTGAEIELEVFRTGIQSGLRIWFADLQRARSPIVELRPTGLNRYTAHLTFGNFAAPTLAQMMKADTEGIQLARALVASVAQSADLIFPDGQSAGDWTIKPTGFQLTVEKKRVENRFGEEAIVSVCRELVTPLLAAMAELYGYDPVEPAFPGPDEALEGAIKVSVVRRRERNPRNRLLCLRIHGETCHVCGFDPQAAYGDAGSIIEVHHLQPLSLAGTPRAYDPATDLVPLCPNCHRAAHTRRPLPWSPEDLRVKRGEHG